MRVRILGKLWTFLRESLPGDRDGDCDPPTHRAKRIRIRASLRGERELDVTIHEMLHAADWHKDEAWVEEVARDIARALWRIGWRRE